MCVQPRFNIYIIRGGTGEQYVFSVKYEREKSALFPYCNKMEARTCQMLEMTIFELLHTNIYKFYIIAPDN